MESAFKERVLPPWSTWLILALVIPASLILFLPFAAWAGPYVAVGLYLLLVLAMILISPVVAVEDGVLRAGRARIPVELLGEARSLDRAASHRELGVGFDARTFRVTVPWAPRLVKVEIADPDDPTPAWLISSRRGDELVRAIDAAREESAAT